MSTEQSTLLAKVMANMTEQELEKGRLADWPDVALPKKKNKEKEKRDSAKEAPPKVLPTIKNVTWFLTRFGISIRDDAFRWMYVLEGVPLREQLDDKAILDFMLAMEFCGLSIGKDRLWDALRAIAHQRTTHELRDLFDQLEQEWIEAGKTPLLDDWLHEYACVNDDAYTRAVASKPLIAAVRRVRSPGYAFKYMPVLEGPQDIRKSSLLRTLAMDSYFDDNLEFGASTKEIMEISSGVLIHEVPELSKMSKQRVESVKAMMSRQKDKARMAYGRTTTQMARQFILWGTSNDRKYLKDPTGGVRFWPVWSNATLEKPIDTEGLSKVVRLMWGEAAFRERQGETVYLEGEALRLAQIAQGERYDGDTNYDALADALEGKEGFLLNHTVYQICEITDERLQQASATNNSIRTAMTKLGWEKGRRSLFMDGKSKQQRGWFKNCPEGRVVVSWWEYEPANRRLEATKKTVRDAAKKTVRDAA